MFLYDAIDAANDGEYNLEVIIKRQFKTICLSILPQSSLLQQCGIT